MYTVSTPSNINDYPVMIAEVLTQIKQDTGQVEVSSEIEDVIKDATDLIGKMVGFDIVPTTYSMPFQEFSGSTVLVRKGNLKTFTSATDSGGTSYGYERIVTPNIRIPDKFTVEFSSSISADPLTLNFTCGWDKDDVPRGLRRVILMKCSDIYTEERSSYNFGGIKYSDVIERTLSMYRNIYR